MTAVIDYLRKTFTSLLVAYINDLLIQAVDEQTCKLHAEVAIIVSQTKSDQISPWVRRLLNRGGYLSIYLYLVIISMLYI